MAEPQEAEMPSSDFDLYLGGCSLRSTDLRSLALGPSPHFLVLSQARKTRLRGTASWPWPDLEGWASICLASCLPTPAEL